MTLFLLNFLKVWTFFPWGHLFFTIQKWYPWLLLTAGAQEILDIQLVQLGGWKLVSWCSTSLLSPLSTTTFYYYWRCEKIFLGVQADVGVCTAPKMEAWSPLMTPSTTHPSARRCWSCVPEVPCVPGPSSHCDQIGVISYSVHAVPWFSLYSLHLHLQSVYYLIIPDKLQVQDG